MSESKNTEEIVSMMSYFADQLDEIVKPSFENIRGIMEQSSLDSEAVKSDIVTEFRVLQGLLNGEYMNNYFKLADLVVVEGGDSQNSNSSKDLNQLEYQLINQYIKANVAAEKKKKETSCDGNTHIFFNLLAIMSDLAYPQFKKNYIPDYEFVTLDSGEPVMKLKLGFNDVVKKIYRDNAALINSEDSAENRKEFEAFLNELEIELMNGLKVEQQKKIKTKLHIEIDLINQYKDLEKRLDSLHVQQRELDRIDVEKQVSSLLASLRMVIKGGR